MVSDPIRDRSLPSSTALIDLGLLDYLQEDPRATFVFNLPQNRLARTAGLSIEFSNHAFSHGSHLEGDAPDLSLSSLDTQIDVDTIAFVTWARQPTCHTPFHFRNLTWKAVTVHDEWRVVSGTRSTADVDHQTAQDLKQRYRGRDVKDLRHAHPDSISSPIMELFDVIESSGTASAKHCRFIRDFDWASTPIGPIHTWPQLLLQTIPFLLCNPEPCIIFWGEHRTMIFNELYTSLIHDLHQHAMGATPIVLFGEDVWGPFGQAIQQIERTKQAIKQDEVMILLDRSVGIEETFFNYTFTPLRELTGQVSGIFCHVVEVTKQVVGQRQLNHLITIGEETSSATTLDGFWHSMTKCLPRCAADLPFVAAYSLDPVRLVNGTSSLGKASSASSDVDTWYLQASHGFPSDHLAILPTLGASEDVGLAAALRLAMKNSEPTLIHKNQNIVFQDIFHGCTDSGAGSSFSQLVVCPLSLSSDKIAAFLILGIKPLRPYDEEHARFVSLVSRQVEDIATSVLLLQKEKLHLQKTVEQAEYQRQWLSEQLQQQTKEARESELRFYNFARQAPVGVYILGPQGEIKFCNDAWYKLIGIPVGFQGPVPWRTHVHPDDIAEVDRQWQHLVCGETQKNFEWRVVRNPPTGDDSKDVIYLRSSCFPELAEDGSMKTVTGVLMDLSVHKAHERAVAERLTSVLEAKRAQENFMDMVSHEMRNPLNAMLQCAGEASQLLEILAKSNAYVPNEMSEVPSALEAIETIQYCGRHQKQIIDDVLTISKIDSNLLTLCPVEATPVNIVDQAVKMFASEIRAANIEIIRNYASGGNYTPCLIDSNRVLQILINLVGNAIKFMKDRPTRRLNLSVATTTIKPVSSDVKFIPSGRQRKRLASPVDWGAGESIYVYYAVNDTGPGLTSEEMDSLFARFKQASPRTHGQYGGSGLGLFISRELAELHGGEIGLASKVRQGSTFAFYVEGHTVVRPLESIASSPLPGKHRQLSAAPTSTDAATSTDSLGVLAETRHLSPTDVTILIVEDNLINQNILQRQLRRLGYKTHTANNGQEALDAIQRSRWRLGNHDEGTPNLSIVLCDLEMPIMDGMTCIRLIREAQRDGWLATYIPMIAVTGNARAEQVTAAKKAGFNSVVCKPYNVPDLMPIMEELVKNGDSG